MGFDDWGFCPDMYYMPFDEDDAPLNPFWYVKPKKLPKKYGVVFSSKARKAEETQKVLDALSFIFSLGD